MKFCQSLCLDLRAVTRSFRCCRSLRRSLAASKATEKGAKRTTVSEARRPTIVKKPCAPNVRTQSLRRLPRLLRRGDPSSRGWPCAAGPPHVSLFILFLLTKGIGRIRQGWLAFASKARKTLGEEGYDANVERNDDLTPSLGGIGTVATGGAMRTVRLRQALGRPDGQMTVEQSKTAGQRSCVKKVPQLGHWCRRHLELKNQQLQSVRSREKPNGRTTMGKTEETERHNFLV